MLAELILSCAPLLDPRLAQALVEQESSVHELAIGIDSKHHARLERQPRTTEEAIGTANKLQGLGYSFSVGLSQIHVSNLRKWGVSWAQAFAPCSNLQMGQYILVDYHRIALAKGFKDLAAVHAALRGYNSGSIYAPVSNNYATSIINKALRLPSVPMGDTNPTPPQQADLFEADILGQ